MENLQRSNLKDIHCQPHEAGMSLSTADMEAELVMPFIRTLLTIMLLFAVASIVKG